MDKVSVIERISRGVVRVLGLNPGPFTLQGSNTYLIGYGERRVLVDTGDGNQPGYFGLLRECLGTSRVDRILLTHWHADHIGGVNQLLEMRDIVTTGCTVYKQLVDSDEEPDVAEMLAGARQRGCLRDIADSQEFIVDDMVLRAVFTPGHTPDHVAFTVSGGSDLMLLTGDHILGQGDKIQGTTTVHDLGSYMESLNRVLALRPTALLPGHGPVVSGSGPDGYRSIRVIEEYIKHRMMREQQILDVLASDDKAWRLEEITRAVYKDITDPKIILAAQNNTLLHLKKLLAENRVQQVNVDQEIRWALIRPNI
ncbi:Beta-lactamase-like protein 2 [Coemansia furcata]|uniref:Beta-lactamase-like protein 2 n=1 Tax=Coemansia furcata TaxID=417177 RepID=A0ACC1LLD8_9FUNG|nr:Beta-lactamase-like protein 2 [Coemansia furcata]